MTSGMSLERVEWHLNNWAEWMQGERVGSSYRNRASGGLRGYGGSDFEEMVDRADARCAEAVNAVISDMPLLEQTAVHHFMLASVFRFERADVALHFSIAKQMLAQALPAKGIV